MTKCSRLIVFAVPTTAPSVENAFNVLSKDILNDPVFIISISSGSGVLALVVLIWLYRRRSKKQYIQDAGEDLNLPEKMSRKNDDVERGEIGIKSSLKRIGSMSPSKKAILPEADPQLQQEFNQKRLSLSAALVRRASLLFHLQKQPPDKDKAPEKGGFIRRYFFGFDTPAAPPMGDDNQEVLAANSRSHHSRSHKIEHKEAEIPELVPVSKVEKNTMHDDLPMADESDRRQLPSRLSIIQILDKPIEDLVDGRVKLPSLSAKDKSKKVNLKLMAGPQKGFDELEQSMPDVVKIKAPPSPRSGSPLLPPSPRGSPTHSHKKVAIYVESDKTRSKSPILVKQPAAEVRVDAVGGSSDIQPSSSMSRMKSMHMEEVFGSNEGDDDDEYFNLTETTHAATSRHGTFTLTTPHSLFQQASSKSLRGERMFFPSLSDRNLGIADSVDENNEDNIASIADFMSDTVPAPRGNDQERLRRVLTINEACESSDDESPNTSRKNSIVDENIIMK